MTDLDPFEVLSMQSDLIKENLEKMLNENSITEDEYNRNICLLAYEFAVNGFPDDCLLTLLCIKGEYFQVSAIAHFKEDDKFMTKCHLIFEVLNFTGHVPVDALATQASASA